MTAVAKLDEIMEKAQEFASTWSLVGGKFDDGTLFAASQERKEELRALMRAALSPTELGGVEGPLSYRLSMVSGVSGSLWVIGDFNDKTTAEVCAKHLLELDAKNHPEWSGRQIDVIRTTPRAAEAVSEEVRPCVWSQEDFESDCWVTSCGNAFSLNDGTPSDNSIKHCCYCGRHVAEELWVDPNEDDDDESLTPPSAKGE